MRRAVCISEPSVALAGQRRTWKFIYIPATNLPQGTQLKFCVLSKGSVEEWEVPLATSRNKHNILWMETPQGKAVAAKIERSDKESAFYFSLAQPVKAGEKLIFCMGSPKNDPDGGTLSQRFIQRRRPFQLYVDTKGKKEFKEPETFAIDVRGNTLKNIRILAPAIVFKNDRFDIFIRFEDAYGNLTGHAPEGTLVELSYNQLRDNLNWKLFVPETGFLTLPNIYFNEPGVYRLNLTNLHTGDKFISNPIQCYPEEQDHLFWGQLHQKPMRFTKARQTETALRHFRDEVALQFFATSLSEQLEETSNEDWKLSSNLVAEFNEEERFVTMLGFQWFGEPSTEGGRHIVYAKDNRPLLRKRDSKYNTLKKIYSSHSDKEMLSIPCLTMAKGYSYDFKDFNEQFERVVEIYNVFGSSERTQKEGNLHPIKSIGRKGIGETSEGSVLNALKNNHRFGFIAGGDDDRGIYANFVPGTQQMYTIGLTAIYSSEYSRDALFHSLYNRRCYATTGARIFIDFNIANIPMGQETNLTLKPGLQFNRHINGSVIGTASIKEITIVRNGKDWKKIQPENDHYSLALDDGDPFDKIALNVDGHRFLFYYLRITQTDGHVAWSSPIWVDQTTGEEPPPLPTKKTRRGKK